MEKNLIKAKKIDAIYNYIKEALDGGLNDVEMIDVKQGLYIMSNENAYDFWEQGFTITVKDEEGNPYRKYRCELGDDFPAYLISEVFERSQDWLIDKANEIYDNFVE